MADCDIPSPQITGYCAATHKHWHKCSKDSGHKGWHECYCGTKYKDTKRKY
jgi:hypothetical protein